MVATTSCDLLVIGGGAAGHAAIGAYRKRRADHRVVLCSAEETLPYMRPTLSKEYLAGTAGLDDLPLAGETFYAGVDLRLGVPVVALDAAARLAVLADDTLVQFTACVVATGSYARRLPIPGADDPRIFVLRSLADAVRLRDATADAGSVIVLGSGFIGCEAAASLARRGLEVTVMTDEERPHQARLGAAVGERIAVWLNADGVELVAGVSVASIEDGIRVAVAGRADRTAGLILIGAGAQPATDFADPAGLATHDGRIVVGADMRTSAAGIWAAGDIVYAGNAAAGRHLTVEHWGEAERMGEIAGAGAAGDTDRWAQVPGFWTTIGDRTLKYAAWGDGYDTDHLVDHGDDRFTVWYERAGILVGLLTHRADSDYERGKSLVAQRAPLSAALA